MRPDQAGKMEVGAMKIAFVGTGNVGGALARSLGRKGHTILLGVRDGSDSKASALAADIGANAILHSPKEAVGLADVAILATPWPATEDAIKSIGDFGGKPLIDCTNPLKQDLSGLSVGPETSGGEQVQAWAKNAKVVKAFNTTGFNIMNNPVFERGKAVMLFCGDHASANQTAKSLIEDVGFDPMEAGPLASARLLEPFALLWIASAYKFGMGREFAFSILRRENK
jgi:8-hydroxy-5-deazaflavin:NADPH oxidoreductase